MTLAGPQLTLIQTALRHGADEASHALARWIDRPTRITVDSFEQLALDEALGVLGSRETPICFCRAAMTGRLRGHLILAFDDASGLALADLLLGHERGTATAWTEMEQSAALETTNIVCCAYLNSLARVLPAGGDETETLIPSSPQFARDFAESLMEFALMDQIVASDEVLLARTEFQIDGAPVDWTLLFVPDAPSLDKLSVTSP
ncbi:MAG: chemotaxis protein CheC [Planctomycetes bacterium]|nr:chemotaxis protein CheC [Planctomycetota bacterium]